jgi:response regulator RpfG family c-di-GMP phosphodiesterase
MEPLPVLIIDDDPSITKLIEKVLSSQQMSCKTAGTVAEGASILGGNFGFSVIVCDHLLPDGLGVDFLKNLRTSHPHSVRVLMTGLYDKTLATDAINSGEIYRFLVKPFTVEDLLGTIKQSLERYRLTSENLSLQAKLAAQNEDLVRANAKLAQLLSAEEGKNLGLQAQSSSWKEASQGMIDLCYGIIQRTDPLLYKHSQRVATVAVEIAKILQCDTDMIEKLQIAAELHDIGLLGCQPALRTHQRNLPFIQDHMDREQMKIHPQTSVQLLNFLPLPDVIEAIQNHHEYIDGTGYPESLREERISKMAQILCVADYYDEAGTNATVVMSNMQASIGDLFDGDIVHALERVISKGKHLPRERSVLLNELLPGMKLSSSIFTASGMLLVKQGQVLTIPIIQRLQQHSESHAITQNIIIES